MPIDTNLDVLRRQIKDCEHAFVKQHGRSITKEDIKKNPKVSRLYKAYRALKTKVSERKADPQTDSKPQTAHTDSTKPTEHNGAVVDPIEVLIREENESEDDMAVGINTELGPTPQGNGKILSIFAIKMHQAESSPLKSKTMPSPQKTDNISSPQNAEFKTPTKPKFIQPVTPVHSSAPRVAFMQRMSAAMESPTSVSGGANVVETPHYLRRNISKFDFTKTASADSSPASSPIKKAPATPQVHSAGEVDFKVSPSPFKLHRHSAGHLVEVFHAHKSLQISKEELEEFGSDDSPSEDEALSAAPTKRRSKTQKRTTRNWKMKPNLPEPTDAGLGKKNLQKVIKDLDQKNQQQFHDYIEGVSDPSDDEKEVAKPSTSGGRKIAPISRNYKRLKINNKSKFKKFRRR